MIGHEQRKRQRIEPIDATPCKVKPFDGGSIEYRSSGLGTGDERGAVDG
jgi:hypothetical protein